MNNETPAAHPAPNTNQATQDWEWLRDAFSARLCDESVRPNGHVGSIDWEAFTEDVRQRFSQPALIKDHLIREAVNQVTEVARTYGETGQLRSRVHEILLPLLRSEPPPLYTCDGKGGAYALLGPAKLAGTLKNYEFGPLTIYADAVTGQMYCRTADDFTSRMIYQGTDSNKLTG